MTKKQITKKAEAPKQEAPKEVKNSVPFRLYEKMNELYRMKINSVPGKFKQEKELQELIEDCKKYEGLTPKKQGVKESFTLGKNGVALFLVKDIPIPIEFTSLFSEDQKEVYFN